MMNRSQECGLQVSASVERVDQREDSYREVSANTRDKASYAPSRTILFVDDEPSLLEVRRLIFEFMGYSVLTAESGEEALEVLRLHAVDAVVVDYLMPGMDGEETARRIRGMRADLPIILSSGCLSVPQRVLETVNASVNKGMRQELLFDILEQQLQLMPTANGVHDIATQLCRSIPV
jgi:CheY-like chemotaxis protein